MFQRIELTKESLNADIAAFNKRIEDAKSQLLALPATASSWKERKRIASIRNRLMTEIDHVKRIRQYASDALAKF